MHFEGIIKMNPIHVLAFTIIHKMRISKQIARQLSELHFGGNWTGVCFREVLSGLDWVNATKSFPQCNSIARILFHANYFVGVQIRVLKEGILEGKDALSFNMPEIRSEVEWISLQDRCWKEVEVLSELIAELPDEQLLLPFVNEKYGNYYRNLSGLIEHFHYHLGQMVILKKQLKEEPLDL